MVNRCCQQAMRDRLRSLQVALGPATGPFLQRVTQTLEALSLTRLPTGTLSQLSCLARLKKLHAYCQLRQADLLALTHLPALESLSLWQLTTPIVVEPDVARGLRKLQSFTVHGQVSLTEAAMVALSEQTALTALSFRELSCQAAVPLLSMLTSLSILSAGRLRRDQLTCLRGLTNLEMLDIDPQFIYGSSPVLLPAVTRLHFVNSGLFPTVRTDRLTYLQCLPNLSELYLEGANLPFTLSPLSRLPRLTRLLLAAGAPTEGLTGLVALRHLSIYRRCGSSFSDSSLFMLRHNPRLERLDLGGCQQITDNGIASLGPMTALAHLSVQHCTRVSGSGFWQLSTLMVLTADAMSGDVVTPSPGLSRGLTATLARLARACVAMPPPAIWLSQLYVLRLGHRVDNHGIAAVTRLTSLRSLGLKCNGTLSDAGLRLLGSLSNLTVLSLSVFGAAVTDKALFAAASRGSAFVTIHLEGCPAVSVGGLHRLRSLAQLHNLTVFQCPHVANSSVEDLER